MMPYPAREDGSNATQRETHSACGDRADQSMDFAIFAIMRL
jgi:hypothetical protein